MMIEAEPDYSEQVEWVLRKKRQQVYTSHCDKLNMATKSLSILSLKSRIEFASQWFWAGFSNLVDQKNAADVMFWNFQC